MRHLLDIMDLSVEEIDSLIQTANDIIANPAAYRGVCTGKKLATLFFEPSTRTRLSFEAAMLDLGGSVLGFSSAQSSSTSKGESVSDTIRTVSCYADIIAMRHPKEGAPRVASMHSEVPVINAGDGGHQHRPFPHHRPVPVQECTHHHHLSPRIAAAQLYPQGCAGKEPHGYFPD